MSTDTDQVLRDLPNGFHDAELVRVEMDLAKAAVRLAFRFWVGDVDAIEESAREARRSGVVELRGVESALIEPPQPGHRFGMGEGVLVDGEVGAYPGEPAPPDDGLVRLWLYVSTWNAKMTFTAGALALHWTE